MKIKVIGMKLLCLIMTVFMIMPCMYAEAVNFTPFNYNEDGKAQEVSLYSKAVYMVNLDTNEEVIDINGDEERVPGSLNNIMTAVLLIEKFGGNEKKMKETYYSAGNAAFDELVDTYATTADIQPDEQVNCYDLLAAIMLPSSCEAANIAAINISGTLNNFVKLMNDKAKELGMTHTHFSSAHGIFSDNNFSSCKDMVKLCRYAIDKYAVFKDIVAMANYQMTPTSFHAEGTWINNTNMALSSNGYYYEPIQGIKTSSLERAGRCFASYAVSGGNSYMIVSMGAPMTKLPEDAAKASENIVFADEVVYYNILDHINLYNWAFSGLRNTSFIDSESEVRDAKVEFGKDADYVNLKPEKGYERLWPTNIKTEKVTKNIKVYENIVAPVKKGDVLGELTLVYNGEVLTKINLVATSDIERSKTKETSKIASAYFKSKEYKGTLVLLVLGILIYTIRFIIKAQQKYLRKKYRKTTRQR